MMFWKRTWQHIRQTGVEFLDDNVMRLSAALSFYTTLSIAPLLLVVIGIAGPVFGEQAARGQIAHELNNLMGKESAEAVQTMLAKSASPGGGIIATVIGFATLLFGATGVFVSLQDALNTVWNFKPNEISAGIWGTIRARLLSFSLITVLAFLLFVSLVFSAVLTALGGVFEKWLPYSSFWLAGGNIVVGYILTALMFATIFKILPHIRPAWSDVWVGALVTAALFTLGKYLIGLYLGHASVSSTYGAAGSFVALLFWVYYSSVILLAGAEFTQVYARRDGTVVASEKGLIPDGPKAVHSQKA